MLSRVAARLGLCRSAHTQLLPREKLGLLSSSKSTARRCPGIRTFSSNSRLANLPEWPATEESLRYDLAVAHRLSALFGFDEIIYQHISVRLPPEAGHGEKAFLVTPGNKSYYEMRPEDLVVARPESSEDACLNVTGPIIHGAIYASRPDVNSILHGHDSPVVAVACLKDGLECVTQDSGIFYQRVGYHDWEGVSVDRDEQVRIAQALPAPKHTLIMRNHGALTTGQHIAGAWVRWFYLHRTCEVLMMLHSSGREINRPSTEALEQVRSVASKGGEFESGLYEWPALKKMVEKKMPF